MFQKLLTVLTLISFQLCAAQTAVRSPATQSSVKPLPKTAKEAIDLAGKSKQFLVIVFHDNNDEALKNMEKVVSDFSGKSKEKLMVYKASIKNAAEADIVKKYGIDKSKLPLVLVFASNGAITGGFAEKATSEQLSKTLVSPLVAKTLKIVQGQKLALVVLQNKKTASNAESIAAANEFVGDPKIKGHAEIVMEDPENPKIAAFLSQCDIKTPVKESTVVLIAPPGSVVGVYPGKVTGQALMDAVTPASGSCGSGCGSGCK